MVSMGSHSLYRSFYGHFGIFPMPNFAISATNEFSYDTNYTINSHNFIYHNFRMSLEFKLSMELCGGFALKSKFIAGIWYMQFSSKFQRNQTYSFDTLSWGYKTKVIVFGYRPSRNWCSHSFMLHLIVYIMSFQRTSIFEN